MTGNIREEIWYQRAAHKTTISHNKFGDGLSMVTGNMTGKAAEDFNNKFWG